MHIYMCGFEFCPRLQLFCGMMGIIQLGLLLQQFQSKRIQNSCGLKPLSIRTLANLVQDLKQNLCQMDFSLCSEVFLYLLFPTP